MGKMNAKALALAEGVANTKMETFDKSSYGRAQKHTSHKSNTLADYIAKGHFDPEHEEYLVDLPDYIPDTQPNADQFATQMSQRYNEYGRDMFISADQLKFLNNLIGRYCND